MFCTTCGAEVPDEAKFCSECGIGMDDAAGQTRPIESLGTTKIYTEIEKDPENFSSTRLYVEKDLGKTVIFSPAEERKPVFGWIVPIEGKDAWKVFKLVNEDGQFIIGRADECAVKLEDEAIDPRHASLRLRDRKIYITDLDSASGTSVNNSEIAKAELQDGDEIKIGSATLKFRKL